MSTPVGVIKKFVDTLMKTKLQGTEAVDAAFKAVGAVNYDVFKSKFSDAQSGLSTQDFLEQKCGIRVNNKDTGAITGSDAGGKTTKTAESIVPETAAAKNLTSAEYKSFTKNGLKVNVTYNEVSDTDAGENFGYSAKTYLGKQKLVVRALYNWWIPESLDLINESLGINFTDGRASINEINIEFKNDLGSFQDMDCATELFFDYDMGRASNVTLCINSDLLYKITANDKNGTLTVKDGANKTLSMINAKGKAFETVVSSATTLSINNKTSSPVTLEADVGTADASKRTKAIKIYGNKLDNVILGGSKADILYGQGGNDSIVGNAGNDKIFGGYGADTLKGGKGNDTLIGGAGNDSLWGDAGADVFVYHEGEGNDIIFGFDKNDTLTLDTIDFTATYKNKAVTLTFEEGSVTFKDFTATTFHINDDTYKISGSKFKKQ